MSNINSNLDDRQQALLTVLLDDGSSHDDRVKAAAGLLDLTPDQVEAAAAGNMTEDARARRLLRNELGSLQSAILESLVALGGSATTRDVTAALADRGHEVVYNTVMSTLGGLHERGLVDRERTGRAYTYRCGDLSDVAQRHIGIWLRQMLSDPIEEWELAGIADGLRAAGVTSAQLDAS